MNLEIGINKYILSFSTVFLIIIYSSVYFLDDGSLTQVLWVYILSLFLFIVLLIESYFTKIILSKATVSKQTLLTKKVFSIDEIKSIYINERQHYIVVLSRNDKIKIGWDYSNFKLFKQHLITFAKINSIVIEFEDNWY